MKKSNKDITVVSAVIGGMTGLFINRYLQNKNKEIDPSVEFDTGSFLKAGLIGVIIGAVSPHLIKFFLSVFSSREEIVDDADAIWYLNSAVGSYKPDEIDQEVYIKGRKIRNAINKRFQHDLLGKARYQGSVDQGTAISGVSDLAILITFKKTSFSKDSDMKKAVFDFFKYEFKDPDLLKVRQQRVSIGLVFDIDGYKEIIDVVPALRTDFIKGKNEYALHENPKFSMNLEAILMNPKVQEDFGDDQEDKKKVIRLLKVFKDDNELPIKSVLIKEFTKKAFDKNRIPKSFTEKLLMTLEFIRDNIRTMIIKSPDNPNIILSDALNKRQKEKIATFLKAVLEDLHENIDSLQEYFPERQYKI
jgi:hypothetical protein